MIYLKIEITIATASLIFGVSHLGRHHLQHRLSPLSACMFASLSLDSAPPSQFHCQRFLVSMFFIFGFTIILLIRLIKASRINITFLMLNLMKQLCDDPFWWIFCDFGFNKSDCVVLQCFWSLRLLMSFWIALNCFVIQRYSKALDKKML